MEKQIFAIVGYTNWGKSHTLYELFNKKQFLPLNAPIFSSYFGKLPFIVINASNEDRPTKEYLDRLKSVLKKHKSTPTTFLITISLIFKEGNHNVREVFKYLKSLADFEVDYLILEKGWYKGDIISEDDLNLMKTYTESESRHLFTDAINESKQAFKKRTKIIAEAIQEIKKQTV
jgi:hypothetical protein